MDTLQNHSAVINPEGTGHTGPCCPGCSAPANCHFNHDTKAETISCSQCGWKTVEVVEDADLAERIRNAHAGMHVVRYGEDDFGWEPDDLEAFCRDQTMHQDLAALGDEPPPF